MKTDNILLIGAILLMAFSVGCIAYGLEEQSTTEIEDEEPQMNIPYIVDEQGRIRIVATVTVPLTASVSDESEDEDNSS